MPIWQRAQGVKAKEEVVEVDIFQDVEDRGEEVDMVEQEGIMEDVGICPTGDERKQRTWSKCCWIF